MKRTLLCVAIASLIPATGLQAVELLIDGGFESSGGLPGWTLEESIYDTGTMMRRDFGGVNSAQQQNFGPQDGDLAIWLRAFAGGADAGPDSQINATLLQEVSVVASEPYTFSGWSRYETFYSGGATTLDPGGPLGGIDSPTTNTFELQFLDATGSVVGTPETINVTDDRTAQSGAPFFDDWIQHTVSGVAPAGAVTARVVADAGRMVWNGGGSESAFYDSFSLTNDNDPTTELLINGDIETEPPEFNEAWLITEDPGGNFGTPGAVIQSAGFANRPDSGGSLGAWIRSFEGSEADPAGVTISQTAAASTGTEYTFTGWSRFEENYSGGLAGFNTTTELQLAFLDEAGEVIGTPEAIDLKTDRESQSGGAANDNAWYEHSLTATAPSGAVSVQVIGEALGMVTNPGAGQSLFFDDFSLMAGTGGLAGDYNNDGVVDAADYTVWADGGAPDSTQAGYDTWANNYGATSLTATSVPEPTAFLLAGGLLALAMVGRARPDA